MSNYAGDITPQEAWDILTSNPDATLVDVRTDAEWRFVGVPDTFLPPSMEVYPVRSLDSLTRMSRLYNLQGPGRGRTRR